MLARLQSAAVFGFEAYTVQVEVDVSFGLPTFTTVGLPDAAVRESRERVRTAIRNSGYDFPAHRVTVNLAPSDVRKEGTSFDLPIALGILAASGVVERRDISDTVFLGALSLDGGALPARGVLPVAAAVRRDGAKALVIPAANAREALIVAGLNIFPVACLSEAVALLNAPDRATPCEAPHGVPEGICGEDDEMGDLKDVRGQRAARRALEVAAAGNHNVLFVGPPGAGKTMLARRLPGVLPPLTFEEALDVTSLHSVAGRLPIGSGLMSRRPFRAPHHTISDVALIGGGSLPRPGEISLAHHGVLFLDEMPEFGRHVLEVLRQPLEEGRVTVARAARTAVFPAKFVLVGAMNPCPCGYYGEPSGGCRCPPTIIERYRSRISGPLRDRIDLTVELPVVPARVLSEKADGESTQVVRERVARARVRQRERLEPYGIRTNGEMTSRMVRRECPCDSEATGLLIAASERMRLSARGWDRVLKVARTIADLGEADRIEPIQVAEALHYRGIDDRDSPYVR